MADWIAKAVPKSHEGRLHRALHVPEDQNIPAAKLAAAKHSSNPHVRHMTNFVHSIHSIMQRRHKRKGR